MGERQVRVFTVFARLYVYVICMSRVNRYDIFVDGSLEAKLPTIWTVEKQR